MELLEALNVIEDQGWLEAPSETLAGAVSKVLTRPTGGPTKLDDFLNGVWSGAGNSGDLAARSGGRRAVRRRSQARDDCRRPSAPGAPAGADLRACRDLRALGGPLSKGTLGDCSVTCPWHGSRFRLTDGAILNGPTTFPQPAYETRVRDGKIEVRPSHPHPQS